MSIKIISELSDVFVQCKNCNRNLHFKITEEVGKYIIPVFIKAIVFQHVGLSWLIWSKEKIGFDFNEA